MKKLMIAAIAVFVFAQVNAQDGGTNPTAKGTWLIEANTGNAMLGTTGIYFSSQDGDSSYNVGLDGGYFIMDDLALRAGLGYGGGDFSADTFSYRLGGKYYINSQFPVGLDLTGASIDGADENPLWLGIQGGYAWFLGDNVAIEPGIRYNYSLNENFTDKGVFQVNIGFTIFL